MQSKMNFIVLSIFILSFIVATTDRASAANYPIQLDVEHPNTTVAAYHDYDFGRTTNDTTKVLKRSKRWYLLWTGISKIVLGFLMPIETRDNVNWRTLNMAHNFQAQFMVLPSIIWPWKVFSRKLREQRRLFDEHGTFTPDDTRAFVYSALEIYMDHKQMNGRECLLKAICEAAHNPIQQRTVFDEVVHTVLTPHKDEVKHIYLEAKNAGSFGADCHELYPKCLPGKGLLDTLTYYF